MPAPLTRPITLALAAAVAAAPAQAQSPRKADGRYQVGPFQVTPTFRMTSGIDTNVFQTLRDPTRDAVVVLSPRLDGALPLGKRLRITGLGFVDAFYFRRQDDERSIDFYGEGKADLVLGALTLFGGGGGGQFHQRFSIDVDERIQRQEKRAHAGLTWQVGSKLSLTARGQDEVFTFAPGEFRLGGDIKEAMDRNTRTATGQLRFALTRRTTLLASADVLEDHFFSQPSYVPVERQSYRYLGGVRIRGAGCHLRPPACGSAGVPRDPGGRQPALSRPRHLRRPRLAPRAVRTAARDRRTRRVLRLEPRAGGRARYRNAFIYERYVGEAVVDLPAQFLGFLSLGFEESDYLLPYPYPTPFSLNARIDHRYTAGATLLRRFGDSLRIGGHVVWARRVSSLPDFSYEGVRYGFTAEVRP